MQLNSHIRRLLGGAALLAIVGMALAGSFAGEAKAVNAPRSVDGIVNVVYWDLVRFWNNVSVRPGIGYYNWVDRNGGVVEYPNTGCGTTSSAHGAQGFYCGGTRNGDIYLDFTQQRGQLGSIGDGTVALWLAHEYGHHAERFLGYNTWRSAPPYHELLADCFAGLYFRYGVYQSGVLAYDDYQEARQMLSRVGTDRDHGSAAQRLRAFEYGFKRVGFSSCVNGWRNW